MSYIWDEWSDEETSSYVSKKSLNENSKTKLLKLEEILDTYEMKNNNSKYNFPSKSLPSSASSLGSNQSPSSSSTASSLSSLGFESLISSPCHR